MEIRLPPLGEGADSGAVSSIFVKIGDSISKDQPIIELESEKAVASIPSPASGVVRGIHVKKGDQVKVGQVLVSLADDGTSAAQSGPSHSQAPVISVAPTGRLVQETDPPRELVESPAPTLSEGVSPPASPSIRRLARELGIDLTKVRGSERGGRIVMADLKRYVGQLQQPSSPAASSQVVRPAPISSAAPLPDFAKWGPVTRDKMSSLRLTISKRMTQSWGNVPHVTQFDEADITTLLQLRKTHINAYKKKGAHLTLLPLVMKALISLLRKHPAFNASIDTATGEVVYKHYYHFGIAIDTEQGLVVPVVKDVDKKSVLDLSLEIQAVAERTRQRKITLNEMQGGTFTISNQGAIGGGHFTPLINAPEVAILGMGMGKLKAVVRGSKIEQRSMLPLALSYDHRLIDGADAARFVSGLTELLENFKTDDISLDS